MKLNIFFISTLLLISSPLYAAKVADTPASKTEVNKAKKVEPSVFERRIKRSEPAVYKQLFSALENNGDDYNRNKLDSIRSLIFCNGWYANRVGNADPKMLALCPMHITVTHKKGITSVLYVRPSQVAKDSPASKVATELEQDVVRIINSIPYRD